MPLNFLKILLLSCILIHSEAGFSVSGESLYIEHCAICHGTNGKGGVGVPLAMDSFQQQVSDEYLKRSIIFGRPGRVMPAYDSLSTEQVQAIVSHIRSWTKQPVPKWDNRVIKGNTKIGGRLFSQHCTSCHGKNAQGGNGTGVAFSRKKDMPVTAPALNNTGFLASANDSMIKNIILSGHQSSTMPAAKSLGLNESDVNNVVAYIRHFESIHSNKKPTVDEPPALIYDSNYNFKQTIQNVKNAAVGMNFRVIREQALNYGLETDTQPDKQHSIVYFCNFDFLYKALAIDPRVGLFLPCRITVVERKGKVQIMSINPNRLSQLFNNDELDIACTEMHEMYTSILEEATL